ncbi:MAG: SprT family zinc-dependent metalloprotease [Peptococcaceae bacterium]|nr:SprT family zinc-dependent metalloprotease [Peptococcaceae bacterium]
MDYTLIRSSRRSVAIELRGDGALVVRAPRAMARREIDAFVASKSAWISAKRAILAEAASRQETTPLSEGERAELRHSAEADLGARVAQFAPLVGVEVAGVGIRFQRTRWGSCSSKGRISLNGLLMLAPEEVRDYVVVHELCHLRQMNHSPAFWAEVARVLPDYKKARAWLKANGSALMMRIGS